MHPEDVIELQASQIDADGAGVGPFADHVVHAAGLAPGERGRVRIEHVSPHRAEAWATLIERIGPASKSRQAPACPAYGRCGGCSWQHLLYRRQLEHKRHRVERALGIRTIEIEAAPSELGYRNVGKYVVGRDERGDLALGAYAPRTHELVPTLGCAVVEPAVDAAARAARDALATTGLAPYDEARRDGFLRYVVVRANREGATLVGLVTTSTTPRRALADAAAQLSSVADGVVWVRNDSESGAILSGPVESLAGASALVDHLGEVPVVLSVGAFFQVNRAQALALYRHVASTIARAAPGRARVADIYCGVGGIGLTLAAAGASVVGVERVAAAIEAAKQAASRAGLGDRVRFLCAGADRLGELGAFDAVVVNPPRKGLDRGTRAALARVKAPVVVYVSCNPDTLARDLRELGDHYEPALVRAFDLMPGTSQVETVVELRAR